MKTCKWILMLCLFSCTRIKQEQREKICRLPEHSEGKERSSGQDCLEVFHNIDTTLVNELISKQEKNIFLVFDKRTDLSAGIFSESILADTSFFNFLKQCTVIVLDVDPDALGDRSSSNTGYKNAQYQRQRFLSTSQPCHFIFPRDRKRNGIIIPHAVSPQELEQVIARCEP